MTETFDLGRLAPQSAQQHDYEPGFRSWISDISDIREPLMKVISKVTERSSDPFLELKVEAGTTHATVNKVKAIPDWYGYTSERMQALERLDLSDPDGVPVPAPRSLRRVWDEVERFMGDTPRPSILPSEHNGVLFVWHKGRWDLEIDVRAEQRVVWMRDRDGGSVLRGSLNELLGSVHEALKELRRDQTPM